jgi:hypothetical protein
LIVGEILLNRINIATRNLAKTALKHLRMQHSTKVARAGFDARLILLPY